MKDFFKTIFLFLIIGLLAAVLIKNDLEGVVKLVIFYLGVKEIPKIFF